MVSLGVSLKHYAAPTAADKPENEIFRTAVRSESEQQRRGAIIGKKKLLTDDSNDADKDTDYYHTFPQVRPCDIGMHKQRQRSQGSDKIKILRDHKLINSYLISCFFIFCSFEYIKY